MNSLGIDIGGTQTKVALVDDGGNVLQQGVWDTRFETGDLIALLRGVVEEFAEEDTRIGIGAPGLAATDNRSIAWMRGRLEAVEGLNWSEHLEREAHVLNDAHATTVGEAWIGAAKDVANALVLTLGTGVGGGVILDHQLYQGSTGRAGHLGHVTVDFKGPLDIVGTPGSLEDAIGNHNVADRTDNKFQATSELVAAVEQGDPIAQEYWQVSIEALAAALTSLVNAFDPQVIVLGGGISECGAMLLDPLQSAMDRCEWRPIGKGVDIVPARLGKMAGAIGAARFAMLRSQEAPRK